MEKRETKVERKSCFAAMRFSLHNFLCGLVCGVVLTIFAQNMLTLSHEGPPEDFIQKMNQTLLPSSIPFRTTSTSGSADENQSNASSTALLDADDTVQRQHAMNEITVIKNESSNAILSVPSWFLEESKLQTTTSGTFVVSNVCVVSRKGGVQLLSFGGEGLSLSPYFQGGRPYHGYLTHTKAYNLTSDWTSLEVSAYISEETLYLDDCSRHLEGNENPAHCLNDLAFSLAVDVMVRAKQNVTPAYGRFLYGNLRGIHMNQDCDNVCCDMITHKLGLANASNAIQVEIDRPVCMAKLVVPNVANLRHVRNAETDKALSELRERMFRATTGILDSTSWPETPPELPTIFLYDRTDSGRRQLANATDIKNQLEQDYVVQVDYMGKDWKDVLTNNTEQARIYNSYRYILTPHGAHLANLIYTRPTTQLLEVQCHMQSSRPRAIHQQWFSRWAPVIGVSHQTHTEVDGCRSPDGSLPKNYSPEWVRVNVTILVEKAATFFGLTRRTT